MWATKYGEWQLEWILDMCGEWQLERIWDKEYVKTWIYFFHSCLKNHYICDKMHYSFQKNQTHFKDRNKKMQPEPQTYVIFFVLRE